MVDGIAGEPTRRATWLILATTLEDNVAIMHPSGALIALSGVSYPPDFQSNRAWSARLALVLVGQGGDPNQELSCATIEASTEDALHAQALSWAIGAADVIRLVLAKRPMFWVIPGEGDKATKTTTAPTAFGGDQGETFASNEIRPGEQTA